MDGGAGRVFVFNRLFNSIVYGKTLNISIFCPRSSSSNSISPDPRDSFIHSFLPFPPSFLPMVVLGVKVSATPTLSPKFPFPRAPSPPEITRPLGNACCRQPCPPTLNLVHDHRHDQGVESPVAKLPFLAPSPSLEIACCRRCH